MGTFISFGDNFIRKYMSSKRLMQLDSGSYSNLAICAEFSGAFLL